ncbi:hypothetical protein H0H93_016683 [Arthromyces matolae]|nr:hypothetical protein H0H93_016683 [Arthromyces matolae]
MPGKFSQRAPPLRVPDSDDEDMNKRPTKKAKHSDEPRVTTSKSSQQPSRKRKPDQVLKTTQSSKQSSGWVEFEAALKAGIGPETRKGRELYVWIYVVNIYAQNFASDGPLKPYYHAGNLIPRMINPFLDVHAIITYGLADDGLIDPVDRVDNGEEELDEDDLSRSLMRPQRQALHIDAYKTLLDITPRLQKTLRKLCSKLDGEDYHTSLLRKLADVTLTQPLPHDKSSRGFNHIDTGRLLCPAKFILSLRNGRVGVVAHDFPTFMYATEVFEDIGPGDKFDIEEGLCRGPLLIIACRHMFFGSGFERAEKHATKSAIAEKYNMNEITPAIIAYTACQTRFALSSVSQWGMQDKCFSLQDFYYNVLSLFLPSTSSWAIETLEFWNNIFYGPDGTIKTKQKSSAPPPLPNSDIVRLQKARLARLRTESTPPPHSSKSNNGKGKGRVACGDGDGDGDGDGNVLEDEGYGDSEADDFRSGNLDFEDDDQGEDDEEGGDKEGGDEEGGDEDNGDGEGEG